MRDVGLRMPPMLASNRRFRVMASVPYQDWIREMGRELESGEAILLGGLAFRRTMDDRVEVLMEEVGVDGR